MFGLQVASVPSQLWPLLEIPFTIAEITVRHQGAIDIPRKSTGVLNVKTYFSVDDEWTSGDHGVNAKMDGSVYKYTSAIKTGEEFKIGPLDGKYKF